MVVLLLLISFVLCCSSSNASDVPDLSLIETLAISDNYQVTVDGKEQVVYESWKTEQHGTNDITTMSFMNFGVDKPTTVVVSPKTKVETFEVRPYSANVKAQLAGNTISFEIDKPQHVVVLLNGSYERALVISAKPVQSVPTPEQVDYFYGPGVHEIGIHKQLTDGQKVYLAKGAVVLGSFSIENAKDVQITGRGILHGGDFPHQEDFKVFRGSNTKHVLIEGITISNAPGWIVSFWDSSEELTVRDVTMVANFRYNTDGVQTGTKGLLVENSFMQCNDDNFSLNGECKDVEIRNNVLWNIYNGGVFMLGWATGDVFDLQNHNIHDNTILCAGGCCDYDRKAPFSMKLFGSHRTIKNIVFKDITIEELVPFGRWVDFQAEKAINSDISDIHFKNIKVLKTWRVEGEIHGMNADKPIEQVSFDNVEIAGTLMQRPSDAGLSLINTQNVTIQGTPVTAEELITQVAPDPESIAISGGGDGQSQSEPREMVNILENPTFAEGLKNWRPYNPGNCTVSVEDEQESDGVIKVSDRKVDATGVVQEMTTALEESPQGNVEFVAMVKGVEGKVSVRVTLRIEDESGVQYHCSTDVIASADNWEKVSRTLPLQWSNLSKAEFIVESSAGETEDFLLDECEFLVEKDSAK